MADGSQPGLASLASRFLNQPAAPRVIQRLDFDISLDGGLQGHPDGSGAPAVKLDAAFVTQRVWDGSSKGLVRGAGTALQAAMRAHSSWDPGLSICFPDSKRVKRSRPSSEDGSGSGTTPASGSAGVSPGSSRSASPTHSRTNSENGDGGTEEGTQGEALVFYGMRWPSLTVGRVQAGGRYNSTAGKAPGVHDGALWYKPFACSVMDSGWCCPCRGLIMQPRDALHLLQVRFTGPCEHPAECKESGPLRGLTRLDLQTSDSARSPALTHGASLLARAAEQQQSNSVAATGSSPQVVAQARYERRQSLYSRDADPISSVINRKAAVEAADKAATHPQIVSQRLFYGDTPLIVQHDNGDLMRAVGHTGWYIDATEGMVRKGAWLDQFDQGNIIVLCTRQIRHLEGRKVMQTKILFIGPNEQSVKLCEILHTGRDYFPLLTVLQFLERQLSCIKAADDSDPGHRTAGKSVLPGYVFSDKCLVACNSVDGAQRHEARCRRCARSAS